MEPHKEERRSSAEFDLARLELARVVLRDVASLDDALRQSVRLAARTLRVDRTSVWLFDEARATLRCVTMYLHEKDAFVDEAPLAMESYRDYIAGIEASRTVVADDALTDARTRALATGYLIPKGITAMMDAALFRGGEVIGVVCHEQVGKPRVWATHERTFAASVADMIALVLETGERLRAEAERDAAEAQLRESRRLHAMGEVAAMITHDFNNLLGVIALEAGRGLRAEAVPTKDAALERILDTTRRATELSRQLLAFGRRLALEPHDIELGEVVRRATKLLETLVGEASTLTLDLRDAPAIVTADPAELERVLVNLVVNARDATPSGGRITVRTCRAPRQGKPGVELAISDTGVGMDAATRARIFEPYFTTKAEGSGLGLAAVYGIVHQCGGSVRVDSSPGVGTTVRVWLPETTVGAEAASS